MTNKINSIIYNESGEENEKIYNPRVFLRKTKIFIKEVLSPKINDFYATSNFLKFRFKVSKKKIQKFENLHKNETIFLIGAGPSLNNENLNLLNGKIVIAYNFSYQALTNIRPKNFIHVFLVLGLILVGQLIEVYLMHPLDFLVQRR